MEQGIDVKARMVEIATEMVNGGYAISCFLYVGYNGKKKQIDVTKNQMDWEYRLLDIEKKAGVLGSEYSAIYIYGAKGNEEPMCLVAIEFVVDGRTNAGVIEAVYRCNKPSDKKPILDNRFDPKNDVYESLEAATMAVLNEDAQHDKAIQFNNAFDMGKRAFASGLGDMWDAFLDTVQRKRREIEQLAKLIKDYVNKAPQDDVYISPYTKEVIAGCDAILEGCENISSGHDHLLNRTHEAMLAKQSATSNK